MNPVLKIFLILLIMFSNQYHQERVDEMLIKSSMIGKISQFISWPQESNNTDDNFHIVILGDHEIRNSLEQLFAKIPIKQKKVSISQVDKIAMIRDCHIVFVSSENEDKITQLLEFANQNSILIMSDTKEFCKLGTHINFVFNNHKIQFEINPDSFKNSQLKVNYHLINLATIVKSEEGK